MLRPSWYFVRLWYSDLLARSLHSQDSRGGCPAAVLVCRESARLQSQRASFHHMIERRTQAAMIVVLDRHESEGLEHAVGQFLHRAEDFGHAVYRASLRLKRDFHEVALSQRLRQAQQASGHGDGLEFRFRAASVFQPNRSQD